MDKSRNIEYIEIRIMRKDQKPILSCYFCNLPKRILKQNSLPIGIFAPVYYMDVISVIFL